MAFERPAADLVITIRDQGAGLDATRFPIPAPEKFDEDIGTRHFPDTLVHGCGGDPPVPIGTELKRSSIPLAVRGLQEASPVTMKSYYVGGWDGWISTTSMNERIRKCRVPMSSSNFRRQRIGILLASSPAP